MSDMIKRIRTLSPIPPLIRTFACLALFMLCLPQSASAQLTLDVCAPGYTQFDYTAKVVDCVETSIIDATTAMLSALSIYMTPTVGIMLSFAIIVFGMRIMSGEPTLLPKAMSFIIKMSLVLVFSNNLYGFADDAFQLMHDLVTLVVGGFNPWQQIDALLGALFGFGTGIALFNGLLGIIGGALFSSTTGVFLFFAGMSAVINLLLFTFRIVFTYLTAVTLLGFTLALSPLIIPLGLFFATERYVSKWLHVLMYSFLVPMLLFAFLSLFLWIFDALLGTIFTTLGWPGTGVPDFTAYYRTDRPVFSWLMPGDPNYSYKLQEAAELGQASIPAVQSNITPTLRRGADAGMPTLPGLDFGPDNVGITQKLMLMFMMLWLFATLMKSMIEKIPGICNNIAAVAGSYITMDATGMERKAQNLMQRGQDKLQAALGKGGG